MIDHERRVDVQTELNILEQKIDAVLAGNAQITTKLAVIEDRYAGTVETLRRYGAKLDDHSKKIRDLEENVRANSDIRKAVIRWLERAVGVSIMAYLGFSKFEE